MYILKLHLEVPVYWPYDIVGMVRHAWHVIGTNARNRFVWTWRNAIGQSVGGGTMQARIGSSSIVYSNVLQGIYDGEGLQASSS